MGLDSYLVSRIWILGRDVVIRKIKIYLFGLRFWVRMSLVVRLI